MAEIIQAFKTEEREHRKRGLVRDGLHSGLTCGRATHVPMVHFADTLWDDLTPADHAILDAKLEMIDNFLNIGVIRHWACSMETTGLRHWFTERSHGRLRTTTKIRGPSMWPCWQLAPCGGTTISGRAMEATRKNVLRGHDLALLAKVTRLYQKSFRVPHFTPGPISRRAPTGSSI